MNRLLTILTTTLLISCGTTSTGYDFETTATYKAVNSNLQVDMTATGHVPAGADIGEGQVKGIITSTSLPDTIYFQTNTTQVTRLTYRQKKIEILNPTDIFKTLTACLDKIGYKLYDRQELKELGKVIQATTYGPKETFMDGQPDLIKVLGVNFKRE